MCGSERREALEYCCVYTPERVAQVCAGAELIRERTGRDRHDMLVILGSGLADAMRGVGKNPVEIPMRDIPGAKEPTAQGHGKRLVSTQVETETGVVNVLVCTGRIHLYEGHAPYEVCHIPQVAAMTGVKTAFLTNAGGCLRPWELGDLMTIRDQVNLSGVSPFTGPVFVDVKRVWNPVLSGVLERHTQRSGVYAILRGPEFQTDAESLMLRNNGVDMVGMSTVLEAIALHQLGVNVCGVSVTSDLSFSQAPTAHCEVLRMVQASLPRVRECFSAVAGASSARRF